jgi:N-acetyl-anhydromuramyl-L-alanine amidase AmpD
MQPIQRSINAIVIHCADTPNGRPQTVADIDSWHLANGWQRVPYWRMNKTFNQGLTSIGYHFVIYTDGSIHTGRHPDEIGAHVGGHNSNTIGICLVGKNAFSALQWAALEQLVAELQTNIKAGPHHLNAKVLGHYQFDTAIKQGKTCPNFDVPAWLQAGMKPDPKNIFTPKEA